MEELLTGRVVGEQRVSVDMVTGGRVQHVKEMSVID